MITKITPHPCLEKTVDHYWVERSGSSNVKILPDGTTSIIFNIGSPITFEDAVGGAKKLSDNLIIGTHKKYYVIKENNDTHIVGIKFKQGGAYNFFKLPMMQFSNKIVNLTDVLNGETEKLRGKLVAANDDEAIRKILDYYFLIKVDRLEEAYSVVDSAIKEVNVDGAPLSIKDFCETANISNKHLISLFNKKVGLSPKLVHRINKFKKVIELLQRKRSVNWPEVAYECQNYDQAHLINEFKSFSGLSPKKYFENENATGLRVEYA
jgi:AraC-like DNA-binding protein